MKIRLDGTLVEVKTHDLDGDGIVGKDVIEKISPSMHGVTDISEPTELGESLRELNSDAVEVNTRMSGIDLRSRLSMFEIPPILAVDSLVAFKFLPMDCLAFTRQKKRLAVSLEGKGREEIVDVVSGKKDMDMKKGGSFFNFGNQNQ